MYTSNTEPKSTSSFPQNKPKKIKIKIKKTLNVSASCGIGPSKLLARLASTAAGAKPNGQGLLSPDPRAIDEVCRSSFSFVCVMLELKLAPVYSHVPSISNQVLSALPLARIPGLQQQRGDRLAALVMEKKGGKNGRSLGK